LAGAQIIDMQILWKFYALEERKLDELGVFVSPHNLQTNL